MISKLDQIQALIAEIDVWLRKVNLRRPLGMADIVQQQRLLERVRSYLSSFEEIIKTGDNFTDDTSKHQGQATENLPIQPNTSESDTFRAYINQEHLSEQILHTIQGEMAIIRDRLIASYQAELASLRQQRESLWAEIRQLEQQRQAYLDDAQNQKTQQQLLNELLQKLMAPWLENLHQEITEILAKQQALTSARNLSVNNESPATIEQPSIQQRLEQLKLLQNHSEELLIRLNTSLQAVFAAMQINVENYQESLTQGITRMHSLGQQGEQMFTDLVNHLTQLLKLEAYSYLQLSQIPPTPTISDQPDITNTNTNNITNIAINPSPKNLKSNIFSPLTNDKLAETNLIENPIENPIETVENNIETVENNIETVENTIETIENNIETVETIENNIETIETVENNIETVENNIETVETIENNIETVETVENNIETVESVETVENIVESVETVENNIETVEIVENIVETVENNIETVETVENNIENVKAVNPLIINREKPERESDRISQPIPTNTNENPPILVTGVDIISKLTDLLVEINVKPENPEKNQIPDEIKSTDEELAGLLDNSWDNLAGGIMSAATAKDEKNEKKAIADIVNSEAATPSNEIEDQLSGLLDEGIETLPEEIGADILEINIVSKTPAKLNKDTSASQNTEENPENSPENLNKQADSPEDYLTTNATETTNCESAGRQADIFSNQEINYVNFAKVEFNPEVEGKEGKNPNISNKSEVLPRPVSQPELSPPETAISPVENLGKKNIKMPKQGQEELKTEKDGGYSEAEVKDDRPKIWYLGIDIGMEDIAAILCNRVTGEVYPISWFIPDKPKLKPILTLPLAIYLAPDQGEWNLPDIQPEISSKELLTIDDSEPLTNEKKEILFHKFKHYLQVAIPCYGENVDKESKNKFLNSQPMLQWFGGEEVSMGAVVVALQELLATIKNKKSKISCAAIGLDGEKFKAVLAELSGVIVSAPALWQETYRFNLREAVLGAGLVDNAAQIFFVEDAIATLLAKVSTLRRGGTLIINISATTTEFCLLQLPQKLENLTYKNFHFRSSNYAGQGIDQDIICQLLWKDQNGKIRDDIVSSFMTNSTSFILPNPGQDDLIIRRYFQNNLINSISGQLLLEATSYLKQKLQNQSSFTLELADKRWVVSRKDLDKKVLQPFVQFLNRELNALLSESGISVEGINQAICTGGIVSFSPIANWLRQKLPNALILQDKESESKPGAVVNGLAMVAKYPQVLDISRQQYNDYFLLGEILRVLPERDFTLANMMQLLESRAINTIACEKRIQAILSGDIPAGIVPAENVLCYLSASKEDNLDLLGIGGMSMFEKVDDRTYRPNVEQCQRVYRYLQNIVAGSYQKLDEPFTVDFGMKVHNI